MKNSPQNLQDPFLNACRLQKVQVSVYLVSGVKLIGWIESFDNYVVMVKNNTVQMVYKHAISTIAPSKELKLDFFTKED